MVDQNAFEMPTEDEHPRTLSYCVRLRGGRISPFSDESVLERVREVFHDGAILNDRYLLRHEIGRGGMGLVFLGQDRQLDREVAIKVIASAHEQGTIGDRDLRRRTELFAEEARLGANLLHPTIAAVFDFGLFEQRPFTVFEYVPGETLAESLKSNGPYSLDDARIAISELAKALDFAHAKGVIHRDLKPANIKVLDRHQYKLLDLGLAKRFQDEVNWSFAGTPAYAAPEQCRQQHCDGRADQYALACIAFELLTSHLVFESKSSMDLLRKHLSEPPPLVSKWLPDAPQDVCTAIHRALSKDPNDRFLTCQDFAAAIGGHFLSPKLRAGRALHKAEVLSSEIDPEASDWWIALRVTLSRGSLLRYAALTSDTIWTNHGDCIQKLPLRCLGGFEADPKHCTISIKFRTPRGAEKVTLAFRTLADFNRWRRELRRHNQQSQSSVDSLELTELEMPLLRRRPDQPPQVLGTVQAEAPYGKSARSGGVEVWVLILLIALGLASEVQTNGLQQALRTIMPSKAVGEFHFLFLAFPICAFGVHALCWNHYRRHQALSVR